MTANDLAFMIVATATPALMAAAVLLGVWLILPALRRVDWVRLLVVLVSLPAGLFSLIRETHGGHRPWEESN